MSNWLFNMHSRSSGCNYIRFIRINMWFWLLFDLGR